MKYDKLNLLTSLQTENVSKMPYTDRTACTKLHVTRYTCLLPLTLSFLILYVSFNPFFPSAYSLFDSSWSLSISSGTSLLHHVFFYQTDLANLVHEFLLLLVTSFCIIFVKKKVLCIFLLCFKICPEQNFCALWRRHVVVLTTSLCVFQFLFSWHYRLCYEGWSSC